MNLKLTRERYSSNYSRWSDNWQPDDPVTISEVCFINSQILTFTFFFHPPTFKSILTIISYNGFLFLSVVNFRFILFLFCNIDVATSTVVVVIFRNHVIA